MKKIAVIAIAVLFLLVGLCYAQDVAGPITMLSFKITYEEYLPATKTLKDGRGLITVTSGLNKVVSGESVYKPAFYLKFYSNPNDPNDPRNGMLEKILISWINPTSDPNDPLYNKRILTIACSGGNTGFTNPNPGLPQPEDGGISSKKQLPVKNTPATRTDSVQGVAACFLCPDGLQFSGNPPTTTGLCNDGTSYVSGYITYSAKHTEDLVTKETISASISATVGAGGFDYIGEDWVAKDCNTYNGSFYCNAVLAGTLKATLTPCTNPNPNWTNCPYE